MTPELRHTLVLARERARLKQGRSLPRRKRFARQVWPAGIEQGYRAALLALVARMRAKVLAAIRPRLAGWVASNNRLLARADAAGDELLDTLDGLRIDLDRELFRPSVLRSLVRPVAGRVEQHQERELKRQLKVAVGIEFPLFDPQLREAIDNFTAENVGLISTIPRQALDQVQTTVLQGLRSGERWETIAGAIEERFAVSESRAALIARDQVGKFYSSLNATRQQRLGITHFTWRASNDERDCDICDQFDGHRYTWGDAPEGGPGHAHPNCRCSADPDIEALLDSL